jgi:hypothetical protein
MYLMGGEFVSREDADEKLSKVQSELARLRDVIAKSDFFIEQTLAQAIGGYPWYKDDQANFPGASEKDGVCVGAETSESLAMTAASMISKLRDLLERWVNAGPGDDGPYVAACEYLARWRPR